MTTERTQGIRIHDRAHAARDRDGANAAIAARSRTRRRQLDRAKSHVLPPVAASNPHAERLLKPHDFINSDDQELDISVAPGAGTPMPWTTTVSVWVKDDEQAQPGARSALCNYIDENMSGAWSWDKTAKPWTLNTLAHFTVTTPPLDLPHIARIGLPPTTSEMHIFGFGQVDRSSAKVTTLATVAAIGRPQLLIIRSGNIQDSPVLVPFDLPLQVGVYRFLKSPFDLSASDLRPCTGVRVKFDTIAPGSLAHDFLLEASIYPAGTPKQLKGSLPTGADGLATVWATPLQMIVPMDLSPSWDWTTGQVFQRMVNASVVDADGSTLPIAAYNDRVFTPPPPSSSATTVATLTRLLHLDAASSSILEYGDDPMPENHVQVSLAGVEARTGPNGTVAYVYASASAREAIVHFPGITSVDRVETATPVCLSVNRNRGGSTFAADQVIDAAVANANAMYSGTGVSFVTTTDETLLQGAPSVIGISLVSDECGSIDLTRTDILGVTPRWFDPNFVGITLFCDFGHNEGLLEFNRLEQLSGHFSIYVMFEAIAQLRPSATYTASQAEFTKTLGFILAHEVGHALGLLHPQLFGMPHNHLPRRDDRPYDSPPADYSEDLMAPGPMMGTVSQRVLSDFERNYVKIVIPH